MSSQATWQTSDAYSNSYVAKCVMLYKIINDVSTRSLLSFINIYNSQDLASYLNELGHEFNQLPELSIAATDETLADAFLHSFLPSANSGRCQLDS